MAEKDYLAKLTVDPEKDKLDHGVMGMKWGQTRSSAELRTAAATRKSVTARSSATKVPVTIIVGDKVGSSSEHYAKLLAVAKAGKASSMNEPDLKFFNSRTEALAKVARLNDTKPGWLSSTVKEIALGTAKQQMSAVTSALATKYVGGRIIAGLNPEMAKTLEQLVNEQVSGIRTKDTISLGVRNALETSDYLGRHKRPLPGVADYIGKRSK